MTKLHVEDDKHSESCERYFWALSMSSQPNPEVVSDLLRRYRRSVELPSKVKETLLLTVSSMAYRLSKLPKDETNTKVVGKCCTLHKQFLSLISGHRHSQRRAT